MLPGSHRGHEALCANSASTIGGAGHFVPLRGGDPLLAAASARFVSCEAGDLVCWDSRTIHCSVPAFGGDGGASALSEAAAGARLQRDCLLRLTAYVCMSPKRVAPEAVPAAERQSCPLVLAFWRAP